MKVGDILKVGRLVFGVRAMSLAGGEEITHEHPDRRFHGETSDDFFNGTTPWPNSDPIIPDQSDPMRVFEPKSENKKEQGDLLKEAELIKITEI